MDVVSSTAESVVELLAAAGRVTVVADLLAAVGADTAGAGVGAGWVGTLRVVEGAAAFDTVEEAALSVAVLVRSALRHCPLWNIQKWWWVQVLRQRGCSVHRLLLLLRWNILRLRSWLTLRLR